MNSRTTTLTLVIIVILLIAGLAAFSLNTLVSARGLRFDFYPHWVGGRAVWAGQTPYTPAITREIQRGMFGEDLPPDADQQNFAYPAYTSLLLGPVLALPAPFAIALWTALQLAAVIASMLIWLVVTGWTPRPLTLMALLLGLTFVFHYPMDTFVLGQFSGTVLLGISLAALCLSRGWDVAAGAVALLATVPPTVGGPIIGLALLAFALRGRPRALVAFAGLLLALLLISIARIGWWMPDWLAVVRAYADYAPPPWPPGFLPDLLSLILVVALVLGMLVTAWRFVRGSGGSHAALDLFAAALLAGLLLIPQTGYYYLVLLIPVIVMTLAQVNALNGVRRGLIAGSCIAAVFSPWLYFALPGHNPETQSLILPLHIGLTWLLAARWRVNPAEQR